MGKNALGLPAAHALNALKKTSSCNARAIVTMLKGFSVHQSSAANNNVRGAVNAQVTVHQPNHQWNLNVTTRVTQKKEPSIHRSNAPKTNATIVASVLVAETGVPANAKTGIWTMTRRATRLTMSIDQNMSVRVGVIQKNTQPNRGTRNALGLPAAHVLNALLRRNHNAIISNATTKRAGKLKRICAAAPRAEAVPNVVTSNQNVMMDATKEMGK